jgi:hypothetical protein
MAGGNGYIQLHRKVMEHPVFEHDGLYRLWSYCLMRANWKEAKTMVPGTLTPIEIRRGQFITGREKLYAALYGENYKGEKTPTSRTLWRWLETLQDLECVKLETVSKRCTAVTVCNYELYQSCDDDGCPTDSTSERTTDVPPIVPPVSTNKESNKGRKKKGNTLSLEQMLVSVDQVPVELRAAWTQWLTYKAQKKQCFVPVGLTSAVTHLKNEAAAHGWRAVEAGINTAMASNYSGWNVSLPSQQQPRMLFPDPPQNKPIEKTFTPVDLRHANRP